MNWHTGRMAAFDLETTSADPETARIVTACVALVGGGKPPQVSNWVADPGVEIPAKATEIHGYDTARARAEGRPAPPRAAGREGGMTTARPLPEHGTPARAKGRHADGIPRCHCQPCRRAERAYDKRRRYLKATGRTLLVPAAPIADHLDALFAAGAGWVQLADLSEVSQSSLSKIRNRQQTRIRRSVADRILSIKPGQGIPARRTVSAVGAVRRVRALMAVGHTLVSIRTAAHLDHTVMHGLVNGHLTTIWGSTHSSLAEAYRTLATRPGGNVRACRRAEREGWHDPLWWDDIGHIDDPDFDPADAAPKTLRIDQVAEDSAWLAETGLTSKQIAERIGVSRDYVEKALRHAAAGDREEAVA